MCACTSQFAQLFLGYFDTLGDSPPPFRVTTRAAFLTHERGYGGRIKIEKCVLIIETQNGNVLREKKKKKTQRERERNEDSQTV